MNVTFAFIGLTFAAECDYVPLIPGRTYGPPENCYPDEGGYAEIADLQCDGKDATFLLVSDIADDLGEAAYQACVEQAQAEREDAEESRAAARADERMMEYGR